MQKTALYTFVTQDRKLTCYHGYDFGELYDLEADPGEVRNLWDDAAHADERRGLLGRIIDYMEILERRVSRIAKPEQAVLVFGVLLY